MCMAVTHGVRTRDGQVLIYIHTVYDRMYGYFPAKNMFVNLAHPN